MGYQFQSRENNRCSRANSSGSTYRCTHTHFGSEGFLPPEKGCWILPSPFNAAEIINSTSSEVNDQSLLFFSTPIWVITRCWWTGRLVFMIFFAQFISHPSIATTSSTSFTRLASGSYDTSRAVQAYPPYPFSSSWIATAFVICPVFACPQQDKMIRDFPPPP